MAINFPNSPALNEVFVTQGSTFIWNGFAWVMQLVPFSVATDAQVIAGTLTNRMVTPGAAAARIATRPVPTTPFNGNANNMMGQRVGGANYQNNRDIPMGIAVRTYGGFFNLKAGLTNPATATLLLGNVWDSSDHTSGYALIPARWWYRIDLGGRIDDWHEWF